MEMKQRDEAEERRKATTSLPAFNSGKLSRTFLRGTNECTITAVECKGDRLQPRFQNRDTEIHEHPEVWQMADPRRSSWGIMTPDVTTPTGPKCTECSKSGKNQGGLTNHRRKAHAAAATAISGVSGPLSPAKT